MAALFHGNDAETQATPFTVALILLGLTLHFLPRDMPGRLAWLFGEQPAWIWGIVAGLGVAMIDALGPEGVAPFIYFQF